jgi:hypothetical protein
MVLIGAALSAIIYPLIQGQAAGWPAWTFAVLGAGAPLLGAFVLRERHHKGDPLIEPRLLADRTYTGGALVALAFFGAFGGLVLCLSLFTQLGEGFSPIHAGLALIPMVIGMLVGMGAGMALVKRLGRRLLHLGVAVVAAGTVGLALTVTGALGLGLGDGTLPVRDRSRLRRRHRPALRLHSRRRRDGCRRFGLRRPRGGPAARRCARRRGPGDDLLLRLRQRAPSERRARNHCLGLPGPARGGVSG